MKDFPVLERRKFVRLHAALEVVYQAIRRSRRPRPDGSFLRNISGGGVRMVVRDELRCGELIDMEIQIPNLTDAVHAIGEVVWFQARKDKEKETNEAGLRFRDILPDDLNRVFEYVYSVAIG
ncbi:MAG: PilZ domain-containing protein [Candidatus Omnitrophica bacterium]|nr:PilZ domain-containing protein [Candidatus Omnitrophota bacterium]